MRNRSNKGHKSSRRKTGPKNCLLSFVSKTPMSVEQALAIGEKFKESPLFRKIIYTYCQKTPSFPIVEKKWPKQGFRPGTESSKQEMLKRLDNAFTNGSQKNSHILYKLYRDGVVLFFKEEYRNIYDLLNKDFGLTKLEEQLNKIVSALVLKKAGLDDLELFFSLYGGNEGEVSRIVGKAKSKSRGFILDLVSENSNKIKELEDLVAKNKGGKSTDKRDESYRSLEARTSQLEHYLRKQQADASDGSIAMTTFSSLEKEVGSVRKTIISLSEKVSSLQSEERENFENLDKKIESTIVGHNNDLVEIEKRLKAFERNLQPPLALLSDLDGRVQKILEQIESVTQDRNVLEELPRKISRISPPKKATIVSKETTFSAHFSLNILKKFELNVDPTQALIYHTLFLESPVVILDDYFLFDAWVNTLGWEKNVISYTATPAWSSEKNWSAGVRALRSNDNIPKFIVIHNFDLALVQCYLLPLLHELSIVSKFSSCSPKIVLVPSELDVQSEYPDILQYGAGINGGDYYRLDNKERILKTPIESVKLGIQVSEGTFVKMNALQEWATQKSFTADDIEQVLRATTFEVSQYQKKLVKNIYLALRRNLSRDEALLASLYHTICHWSKAKYGEELSRELVELSSVMVSGKITY